MFYDPVNQRVLLFGGAWESNAGYIKYNDLWSYDYTTDTWTEVETSVKPSGWFNW